jgi:hypothetical protein
LTLKAAPLALSKITGRGCPATPSTVSLLFVTCSAVFSGLPADP